MKYVVYYRGNLFADEFEYDSESEARKKCFELNSKYRSFGWTYKEIEN